VAGLATGRTGETRSVAGPSFPDIALAVKRSISADREGLCRLRAERTALQLVLPRHLRPRREKIFGPAPSHQLDGNAKARVWAAASAYNSANRRPGQHQGPLTWATLRVLRTLLWRFHSADGGGRCFPSYERIAAVAKCARSSVAVALRQLEAAGLLTWVHRIARIRRQERDLFGRLVSVWQVIRTSNGYRFTDPLDGEPGRRVWCKSENRSRPQNRDLKKDGAPLVAAQVISEETSRPPPLPAEPPALLANTSNGAARALLTATERTALIARLDTSPTKADWAAWERELEARLS
jgi:hypothetical protein